MIKDKIIRWFGSNFKEKNRINKIVENSDTVQSSLALLSISPKHAGFYALIPENFDLDAHIQKFPLTNYKFKEFDGKLYAVSGNGVKGFLYDKERLFHILDLLSSIPARNNNYISEQGFVSINSTIIRDYFKDYLSYLDYLIDTGIIISDNYYILSKKSIGYKYTPEYEESELKEVYFKGFDENNILPVSELVYDKSEKKFLRNTLLDYSYLTHWLNQKKLRINYRKARRYAKLVKEKKVEEGFESWDINH